MLPMMNEIDKRAVVEINNEHLTEGSNLVGNDTNFIDTDNNDIIENHYLETEQLPSISEKLTHTSVSNPNDSMAHKQDDTGTKYHKQTIPSQYVLEQPIGLSSPNDTSKMNFLSETPSKKPQNVSHLSVTVPVNVPEIKPLSEMHQSSIDASNLDHVTASEKPEEMNSDQKGLSTSVSKTKRKRFLCEVCTNRGFTTKYSLRRHNDKFHSLNKVKNELNKNTKHSSIDNTEDISKSLKRSREIFDDETDEIHSFPDSKKLKVRGLKRSADVFQNSIHEKHLPRKSARIESFKRKNQWTENSPAKRLTIQRGQGFSNWVNF